MDPLNHLFKDPTHAKNKEHFEESIKYNNQGAALMKKIQPSMPYSKGFNILKKAKEEFKLARNFNVKAGCFSSVQNSNFINCLNKFYDRASFDKKFGSNFDKKGLKADHDQDQLAHVVKTHLYEDICYVRSLSFELSIFKLGKLKAYFRSMHLLARLLEIYNKSIQQKVLKEAPKDPKNQFPIEKITSLNKTAEWVLKRDADCNLRFLLDPSVTFGPINDQYVDHFMQGLIDFDWDDTKNETSGQDLAIKHMLYLIYAKEAGIVIKCDKKMESNTKTNKTKTDRAKRPKSERKKKTLDSIISALNESTDSSSIDSSTSVDSSSVTSSYEDEDSFKTVASSMSSKSLKNGDLPLGKETAAASEWSTFDDVDDDDESENCSICHKPKSKQKIKRKSKKKSKKSKIYDESHNDDSDSSRSIDKHDLYTKEIQELTKTNHKNLREIQKLEKQNFSLKENSNKKDNQLQTCYQQISQSKLTIKSKENIINKLTNDLENQKSSQRNIKDIQDMSIKYNKIENLIAQKCPNLQKISLEPGLSGSTQSRSRLYENIEEILQKMLTINEDKKNLYQDKKRLQKENKESKKKIENLEIEFHQESEKSYKEKQKLTIEIEDMKYELQEGRKSIKRAEINFKDISEQLIKSNEKVKNLESQIVKQDVTELTLFKKNKEICELKEKLASLEKSVGEKNIQKSGKSFNNLSDSEKRFLRPDLFDDSFDAMG